MRGATSCPSSLPHSLPPSLARAQSAANPDANIGRLNVIVASYDTGIVSTVVLSAFAALKPGNSYVTNNGALAATVPGLTVQALGAAPDRSRDDLRALVRSGGPTWAAVIVEAGASARLAAATMNATVAATYVPSAAITVVWDEARNNAVATARVGGPLKGLVGNIAGAVNTAWATAYLANPTSPLPAAQLARILTAGVYFSEESLFPFTVPSLNQALSVGQILCAVFALVVVNLMLGPLLAHPITTAVPPGVARGLRRLGLATLYACMVGVAFATIIVGIAGNNNLTMLNQNYEPGVTYGATNAVGTFTGSTWATVWAIIWMQTLVFVLWLAIFTTAAGDNKDVAGFFLGPLIIFNAISISVDVSDPGFQFFWYAPFWHSSELIRNVFFGTLANKVGMHVGVMFLWLVVELTLFFIVNVRAGRLAEAAAAARKPAAPAPSAAPASSVEEGGKALAVGGAADASSPA